MRNTSIKGNQNLEVDRGFIRNMNNTDNEDNTDKIKVSPVYNVLRIPLEKIQANNYNPNSVASPEMRLLETSIIEDGFTMPIVCYYDSEIEKYIIVDGFHRFTIAKESHIVNKREGNTVPVTVINKNIQNRVASTIRHNKARGTHDISVMVTIVEELVESGLGDDWIKRNLGMEQEELLKLKQVSGLSSLFKDAEFNKSWLIE